MEKRVRVEQIRLGFWGQRTTADTKKAEWPISKLETNSSACRGNLEEHLLEVARNHSEHFITRDVCNHH